MSFTLSVGDDSSGADVGFCGRDDCVLVADPEFLCTSGYLDSAPACSPIGCPGENASTGSSGAVPRPAASTHGAFVIGPGLVQCFVSDRDVRTLAQTSHHDFCGVAVSTIVLINDPVLVERIERELKGHFANRLTQIRWPFLVD
jgi:hypothetical protein